MAPQHILSPDTINLIIILYRDGFSAKTIVEEARVAKRTIECWLTVCCETAHGVTPTHLAC